VSSPTDWLSHLDKRTVEPNSLTLSQLSAAPRSRRAAEAMEAKVDKMVEDKEFVLRRQSEYLVLGDGTPIALYLGCDKEPRGGRKHKPKEPREQESHGIPVSLDRLSAYATPY
jgi:hypothetical protein